MDQYSSLLDRNIKDKEKSYIALTTVVDVIKLFSSSSMRGLISLGICPRKEFQQGLVFASKAGAYPSEAP
jgi:hypothetical protein